MDPIRRLLDYIHELVHEPGKTWQEKRSAILSQATELDGSNLAEFSAWFVEDPEA